MLRRFVFAAVMAATAAMASLAPAQTTPEAGTGVDGAAGGAGPGGNKELSEAEEAALAKARAMGEGEPRALIIDILGLSEPAIDAFDELNDGASILLGDEAELVLTYYPTCEDLTIRGGRISIEGERMTLDDGKLVARETGHCPGDVRLSPADIVNASVLLRSIRRRPLISTTPKLIGVTGPGSENYSKIAFYGPEGLLFEADLDGRRVPWPEQAGDLAADQIHTVVLSGADVQTFAARVRAVEDASPVTVFRLK